MKRGISRLGTALLSVLMLVCLCACGGDVTLTTTTADDATTTVADEITTTVSDEVTTVGGDEVTTAVDNDGTTVRKDPTTTKEPTANVVTTVMTTTTVSGVSTTKSKYRPWDDVQPTTEKQYATLATVQRDPKYDNEHGVYHALLGYTSYLDGPPSKSQWLPAVGYVQGGKVVDVMYDSVIILPPNLHIYYRGEFDTKAKWDAWRKHTYKALATLNEATAQVQSDLNLKEYKVKVFLTFLEPDPARHKDWGAVNGVSYGARSDDESYEMMKYMIDSYIAEMAKEDLPNLEFAGFYFFDERLNTNKALMYMKINEYINSKGLISIHLPYYKSAGWNYSKTYGFDLIGMQSNYFHNQAIGYATTGSIKRLTANQEILVEHQYTNGITVECPTVTDHDDITTMKNTFAEAIRHGTETGFHAYYFGDGSLAPYKMSRDRDVYIRSGYDDLYKYIHHTLTLDNLQIDEYNNPQKWLDGAVDRI